MEKKSKQKKTIGSVKKAFDIINYIAEQEHEQGATEISEALGYGVSATYHILNTLKESNIITQNENTKKYKLSIKLWQLGMTAYNQNNISDELKPFLVKLRDYTGETANLTILEGEEIVYVAQEESDKMIKMFTKTGATAPLHCTASGKIFLAYKEQAERNEIIDGLDLIKFTDNTITKKEELVKELQRIKKDGYGFDVEERDEEVSCIAAPVFGPQDELMACLSISGPNSRFNQDNKDRWIKIIVDIAKEASEHLTTFK
ncbi:IclR family transcriptional regulator [Gudongella sp. DL1XJH-153]|uniref:IclR family transcriptional regulator n=1 Tax=Gudongella sp. DL1XJH-153 TaxID=3409804 RepID=UPI003BB4ADB8